MPPKKKEEAKPKPLIGRVGTNLKMGIVGLPNAGLVLSEILYNNNIVFLENQLFLIFSLNQVYLLRIFLFVRSIQMKVIQ
jgi:hypothetical protein